MPRYIKLFLLMLLSPGICLAGTSTFDHGLFDRNSDTLLEAVRSAFEKAAIPIYSICLLMIIIGAFYYLTSGGDPKRAETGKGYVMAAITGAALASFAYLILRFLGVAI